MIRTFWMGLAAVAVVLAGCEHNEYSIELAPRGNEIQRKLTVVRLDRREEGGKVITTRSAFPADELAAITAIYGRSLPSTDPNVHAFEGAFAGALPDDVGSSGTYAHVATEMGRSWAYVECFRGTDDLAGEFRLRSEAADRIVDLLIGWFEKELEGRKDLPALRAFLDGEVRRDVRNLALYGWLRGNVELLAERRGEPTTAPAAVSAPAPAAGAGEPAGTAAAPEPGQHIIARVCQYLLRRRYVTAADLPALLRVTRDDDTQRALTALVPCARELLARKTTVRDPETIDALTRLLQDPDAAVESLRAYLRTTRDYKELPPNPPDPDHPEAKPEPPDPLAVLSRPAETAFQLDIFGPNVTDKLDVRLAVEGQVIQTNGSWDPRGGRIAWSVPLPARAEEYHDLPAVLYAVWAAPDEAFQKARFGRVVFTGWQLVEYGLWRKSLAPQEARQWDQLLARLDGGPGVVGQVKEFRFAGEGASQPGQEQKASYAHPATSVILEALEPKKETQPAETGPDKGF